MPNEPQVSDSAKSPESSLSPLARLWAKAKQSPLVASLIFLAPVVVGGLKFGKDVTDFAQKLWPEVPVQDVVKGVSSDAIEVRIAAIRQISEKQGRSAADVDIRVRSLEAMIARRAPKWPHSGNLQPPGNDIGLAMLGLAKLMESSDTRQLGIVAPTIAGVSLQGVNLPGAYLHGFTFSAVNLNESNLASADLQAATIRDVQLARAQASGVKMIGATLEASCLEEAVFARSDLTDTKFMRSDLNAVDLTEALLIRSLILETRLNGAILDKANLTGSDFSRATEVSLNQLKTSVTPLAAFRQPAVAWRRSTLSVCR